MRKRRQQREAERIGASWEPRTGRFASIVFGCWLLQIGTGGAQPAINPDLTRSPPFTTTLSNLAPLAIGMATDEAGLALGARLAYVSGSRGNEIYLADRSVGGSGLFAQHHRLYLQFRNDRLAGWKGDWGHNWMWR
jgi:hypothetical protein